ncbi:YeeE/YedE thiosulfate transporter family protein [Deltaproteobacteria bacterium]|nr:YeeE/YedE thiosulfate transporter family protein [Deltaproteobacteria bacterium]
MAKSNIASFICGIVFSIGLGISGMTQPQKVIGFLDVFGEWDLSLAFVMFGAVLSYLILQLWIQRNFSIPLLGGSFQITTRKNLDRSLIIGALLFGSGWGLGGYCPGPVISSLGSGSLNALLFVVAMGIGMLVADRVISPMLSYEIVKR